VKGARGERAKDKERDTQVSDRGHHNRNNAVVLRADESAVNVGVSACGISW
jgi:hypothetical protein